MAGKLKTLSEGRWISILNWFEILRKAFCFLNPNLLTQVVHFQQEDFLPFGEKPQICFHPPSLKSAPRTLLGGIYWFLRIWCWSLCPQLRIVQKWVDNISVFLMAQMKILRHTPLHNFFEELCSSWYFNWNEEMIFLAIDDRWTNKEALFYFFAYLLF